MHKLCFTFANYLLINQLRPISFSETRDTIIYSHFITFRDSYFHFFYLLYAKHPSSV